MILYVMRHGLASDTSPTGRDRDRSLTEEGRRGVEHVGRSLLAFHGRAPRRIVSSPYMRAQETAELMAKTLGALDTPIDTYPELEPDETVPLGLLRGIAERDADALLVGHHPMVIALLRMLVRNVADLPLGLQPGMLVGVVGVEGQEPKTRIGGAFDVTTIIKPSRV